MGRSVHMIGGGFQRICSASPVPCKSNILVPSCSFTTTPRTAGRTLCLASQPRARWSPMLQRNAIGGCNQACRRRAARARQRAARVSAFVQQQKHTFAPPASSSAQQGSAPPLSISNPVLCSTTASPPCSSRDSLATRSRQRRPLRASRCGTLISPVPHPPPSFPASNPARSAAGRTSRCMTPFATQSVTAGSLRTSCPR